MAGNMEPTTSEYAYHLMLAEHAQTRRRRQALANGPSAVAVLADEVSAGGAFHEWASRWGVDEAGPWAEFTFKGVVQRMRWIAPGRFWMGSPLTEAGRDTDEDQHEVEMSDGYWLADTTCTQELWEAVMGENPAHFRGSDNLPVEQVSWNDCQEFLKKINAAIPGLNLRLPSEEEWEYACRAGTTTPFSTGETIRTDQANFDGIRPYGDAPVGEYRAKTVPVKSFPPNAWGLYEMHGNVWEWCRDVYGPYAKDRGSLQHGIISFSKVIRGGSCQSAARGTRAAFRNWVAEAAVGFRVGR